jgi:hypothetical protein
MLCSKLYEGKIYLNSKIVSKKRCEVETDGRLEKAKRKSFDEGKALLDSTCVIVSVLPHT